MQSRLLRAWKLGLTTLHGAPSMMWMPTWPHFLEVGLGTCIESRVEQKKLDPTLNTNPVNIFA